MSNVHMIGIPMDLGQTRRGVDMGPSAVRYAGLSKALIRLGHEIVDQGNIVVANPEERVAAVGDRRVRLVGGVCQQVYEIGRESLAQGAFALFIGGDHSISIGSVKAAAGDRPETLGVIWVDAHGDFNTPEISPSGNLHGMPVAVLTGDGHEELVQVGGGVTIPAANFVQIGIRDLDVLEGEKLAESDVHVLTMRQIDEHGIAAIVAEALQRLAHCDRLHVSFDLDVLDPAEAPGVGTPVRGGMTYREAHLVSELLADTGLVRSLDLVEVNPILDNKNETAELAVGLAASMLGKRIVSRGG